MESESTLEKWREAQDREIEYPHFENPVDVKYFCNKLRIEGPEFFNGKRVLEVGAGNGAVYELKYAEQRVGIDPLSSAASKYLKEHHNKNKTHITTGAGEKLPFDDSTFDVVINFNVLDHTHSPRSVIKESKRVLDDGGEFLLHVHTFRLPKLVRELLRYVDQPHTHHFSASELISEVEDLGLSVIKTWEERKSYNQAGNLKMKVAVFTRISEFTLHAKNP